jgi:hypothetical protein
LCYTSNAVVRKLMRQFNYGCTCMLGEHIRCVPPRLTGLLSFKSFAAPHSGSEICLSGHKRCKLFCTLLTDPQVAFPG